MTKKDFIALTDALHHSMPVKGCHGGRGWRHSEACYELCFDSWQRDVNEIARTLEHDNPKFNREHWLDYIAGKCGPNGGAKPATTTPQPEAYGIDMLPECEEQ